MIYYDEDFQVVENPDLEAGYTYLNFTDTGEIRTIYHRYTQDELDQIKENKDLVIEPTLERRVEEVESKTAELSEALDLILSGVIE